MRSNHVAQLIGVAAATRASSTAPSQYPGKKAKSLLAAMGADTVTTRSTIAGPRSGPKLRVLRWLAPTSIKKLTLRVEGGEPGGGRLGSAPWAGCGSGPMRRKRAAGYVRRSRTLPISKPEDA